MGLISDLTAIADDIYGIRDDVGAVVHEVYFVQRTWSGSEPGDGTATDVATQMLPTPAVKNLEHNFTIMDVGRYKKGDLLLKGISKGTYSSLSDIDLSTASKAVEKFYRVNGEFYNVISIRENYISWDIHIRKTAN